MKRSIVLGIIIVLLILVGIYSYYSFTKPSDNFSVKYFASYVSSAGNRYLNITYHVEKGAIVSCGGTYTTDMTDGINIENCDVQKLKNKEYNVPINLITNLSRNQQMKGEVLEGPGKYSWEILIS